MSPCFHCDPILAENAALRAKLTNQEARFKPTLDHVVWQETRVAELEALLWRAINDPLAYWEGDARRALTRE